MRLSQDFFRDIIERPVPVDLRVLRALSSPALDIYCWLICRASDLREPTEIPWPTLALQFGAAYADPRRFRDSFLRQVIGVLRLYPAVHVSEGEHGLVLSPIAP
ncbi:MAG TPA: replication protein RepA [Gemmatimonadales bacterium]|nr:replication protein RepA [Gemmatimonadales bacterium]